MAISLDVSTLKNEFEHIYSNDESLDLKNSAFNHELYVETGDRKHIPTKGQEEPTVFTLRKLYGKPLSKLVFLQHELQQGNALADDVYFHALAYGFVDVENLEGFRPKFKKDKDGFRYLDGESAAILYSIDGGSLFFELANRVASETFGGPEGK